MAEEAVTDKAEWVTVAEAASRLGFSANAFRRHARAGGVQFRLRNGRNGRMPAVNWASVEEWIARSKIEPPAGGITLAP